MLKKTANWKSIKSCSTPLLQAWGWRAKTVLPWPELIGLSNATRIPVVSHADYIPGRNILSFNFINLLVSLVRGVSKAAALEEVRQSCQRRAVFHACGGRLTTTSRRSVGRADDAMGDAGLLIKQTVGVDAYGDGTDGLALVLELLL